MKTLNSVFPPSYYFDGRPLSVCYDKRYAYLRKAIVQLDRNGKFIRKWNACRTAAKTLGIYTSNITACCKGKRETAGGYRWAYDN